MAITLLGTSHISPKSAARVRSAVASGEHDIVALELDKERLQLLLSGETRTPSIRHLVRHVGLWGALFAKLGHWVEHKMGGRIGTVPGTEMRAAVEEAAKKGLPVSLIDRPLPYTLRRFNKAFDWREKLRLLRSLFTFRRVQFDLRGVPDEETVSQMVTELERVSPAMARVLVHERNEHMARQLLRIQERHPKARILAVVGAGHVPGMREILNKHGESDTDDAPARPHTPA